SSRLRAFTSTCLGDAVQPSGAPQRDGVSSCTVTLRLDVQSYAKSFSKLIVAHCLAMKLDPIGPAGLKGIASQSLPFRLQSASVTQPSCMFPARQPPRSQSF